MYSCNSCLLHQYIYRVLEILGPRNTFWSSCTPFSTLNSESNRCITLPLGRYVLFKFIIDRIPMIESLFCKTRLLKKQNENTALKQH